MLMRRGMGLTLAQGTALGQGAAQGVAVIGAVGEQELANILIASSRVSAPSHTALQRLTRLRQGVRQAAEERRLQASPRGDRPVTRPIQEKARYRPGYRPGNRARARLAGSHAAESPV